MTWCSIIFQARGLKTKRGISFNGLFTPGNFSFTAKITFHIPIS